MLNDSCLRIYIPLAWEYFFFNLDLNIALTYAVRNVQEIGVSVKKIEY
jgi:hypothetical protein